jgi:hypothetical protein
MANNSRAKTHPSNAKMIPIKAVEIFSSGHAEKLTQKTLKARKHREKAA